MMGTNYNTFFLTLFALLFCCMPMATRAASGTATYYETYVRKFLLCIIARCFCIELRWSQGLRLGAFEYDLGSKNVSDFSIPLTYEHMFESFSEFSARVLYLSMTLNGIIRWLENFLSGFLIEMMI